MAEMTARERVATALEVVRQQAHRTQVERAAVIESAVMALLEDRLGEDERRAAEREAHKIAGSAGTFGLPRASDIARELEVLLAGHPSGSVPGLRAAALVEDLHAALTGAGGPDPPPTSGQPVVTLESASPGTGTGPAVLVMHPHAGLAAAVGRGAVLRGLVPVVTTDVAAAFATLAGQDAPKAAAVEIPVGAAHDPVLGLIRELDKRETAVVGLVPPGADTKSRVTALRAGARSLIDLTETDAGAAVVADALALLTVTQEHLVSRVLVVDDDETVLLAVRALLHDGTTRQVETLDDPQRFWDVLVRVEPHLVVLDIDMPGLSGLELCRLLHSDSRWNQLPVLFLSGSVDEAAVRQVFAAGADDFVRKPVLGPELRARVANQLERSRLHRLLTETDPLTGLANRQRLEWDLERLGSLADRSGSQLSLAVLNIDDMRGINEQYGHAVGDEVLRRFASHLREAFHGQDALARIGDAEYVVAMPGVPREDAVERLHGVLADFGRAPQHLDRGSFTVGVSAGVAEHRRDGVGFEALHRAATGALRVAEASGRGRVQAAGVGSAADAHEVDIVVVEDDEVLADLLRHTLTAAGFRCVVLPDGLQAIERLTAPRDPLRAAVVLLDIDLPGRSGYEVLHALREAGVTARTAVVVLTARSTENEAMRALRGGAADHIAKPFSVPMLVQKVRGLVPVRP